MGDFAIEWLRALWMVLVESGPYLLVGFIVAGILSVAVPAAWIARKLGGDDVKSVATAAVVGVPVPLCSCSVIPTATQLRRSGASRGATTSFLIATPETGVDSIGATWALMDPLMTVVRPLAAFCTAFASGVAVNVFGKDDPSARPLEARSLAPPEDASRATALESEAGDDASEGGSCCATPAPSPAAPAATCHATSDPAPESRVRRVFTYAFGTLLDDLTPWFLIGFAISGLIVVAVPDGFFAGTLFTGWTAMLAMLVAGVPLYVCATASTPIAAAMMAKGLEPGAALVFLLAGPATNVATMLVVRDLLGRRALWIYLASIAVLSLVIGAIVNRLYPAFGLDPTAMDVTPGAMEHGPIATISGVALALLLARSAWRLSLGRRFGAWLRKAGHPIGLDPTAWPVKFALAALVVLSYAATAVTPVRTGETVFVERFGRVVAEAETPGPLVHLPWPLASVKRVDTSLVRTLEFGVVGSGSEDRDTARSVTELDIQSLREAKLARARADGDAEMMTGNEMFVAIRYAVLYRVDDARTWIYGATQPEMILGRLAQESVRRVAATRTMDELLLEKDVAPLERAAEDLLRKRLREVDLGAVLVGIELQSAHAPAAVHSDYRMVASALVETETMRTVERSKAATLESEARIEARREGAEARREHLEVTTEAAARAVTFLELDRVDRTSNGAIRNLLRLRAQREALEARIEAGAAIVAAPDEGVDVIVTTTPQRSMLDEMLADDEERR